MVGLYDIIYHMDILYKKTYNYLLSYGFCPVHKGFKYIISAVIILCQSKVKKSMRNIYTDIAQKCGISPFSVQKNIKYAIDYASITCNIDFFTKEFGGLIKNGGISCGAFLCYVADNMQYGNYK